MNKTIKIIGVIGILLAIFIGINGIYIVAPPFGVTKTEIEEKTKSDPLSENQKKQINSAIDVGYKSYEWEKSHLTWHANLANLSLFLISLTCLIMGLLYKTKYSNNLDNKKEEKPIKKNIADQARTDQQS